MSTCPAPQAFPPVPTTPLSSESEERQGDLIDLDSDPCRGRRVGHCDAMAPRRRGRRRRAVRSRPAGRRDGDADRAGDLVGSRGGEATLVQLEVALSRLPHQPTPRRLPPRSCLGPTSTSRPASPSQCTRWALTASPKFVERKTGDAPSPTRQWGQRTAPPTMTSPPTCSSLSRSNDHILRHLCSSGAWTTSPPIASSRPRTRTTRG